jgi:ubiquinone/menaquinone biosynthesis C-methylase UbiE
VSDSLNKKDDSEKYNAAYWKVYWNDEGNVCTGDPQKDVCRTFNEVTVSKKQWDYTVDYIAKLTKLNKDDALVELCCGNALLLGPLSKRCNQGVGVDFSQQLISQAGELFPGEFKTICSDVLSVELPANSTDVVLVYFSIQHFDQKNAISLIEKAITLLKPGGRLLVGDIPDKRKLWQYLNKIEYRIDYIQRILASRPMIGTWFEYEFFEAIGEYLGNVDVRVIQQPDVLINSAIRYDVLYTKNLLIVS